jgi:hypothetical protein
MPRGVTDMAAAVWGILHGVISLDGARRLIPSDRLQPVADLAHEWIVRLPRNTTAGDHVCPPRVRAILTHGLGTLSHLLYKDSPVLIHKRTIVTSTLHLQCYKGLWRHHKDLAEEALSYFGGLSDHGMMKPGERYGRVLDLCLESVEAFPHNRDVQEWGLDLLKDACSSPKLGKRAFESSHKKLGTRIFALLESDRASATTKRNVWQILEGVCKMK